MPCNDLNDFLTDLTAKLCVKSIEKPMIHLNARDIQRSQAKLQKINPHKNPYQNTSIYLCKVNDDLHGKLKVSKNQRLQMV